MTELVTRKGTYRPGEPAGLRLCVSGVAEGGAGWADISVYRLAALVHRFRLALAGETTDFDLPVTGEEGVCYGVEAKVWLGGEAAATVATAVNFGGDVVRYGFLSDFLPEDEADMGRPRQVPHRPCAVL